MEQEQPRTPGPQALRGREQFIRGGRWLVFAPVLWFATAPVAVFAHTPLVLACAMFRLCAIWLFTTPHGAEPLPRRACWAWLLRALALAEVAVVAVSWVGYLTLLLAELSACLGYVACLVSVPGRSRRRRALNQMALGAALCCSVVLGGLLAPDWLGLPASAAACLAVPLAIAAWLSIGDLCWAAEAERDPLIDDLAWRAALRRPPSLINRRVFLLAAGVAVTAGGACSGLALAYGLGFDPGTTSALVSFSVTAANAVYLLAFGALVGWNWRRLRWAAAACSVFQVPIVWLCVFRPQFDADRWQASAEPMLANGERLGVAYAASEMAEDIVYSRLVIGKTRAEVQGLLGLPSTAGDTFSYWLRGNACRGFNVSFRGGRCSDVQLFNCD